jgi:ATP-binding cassette subfamily B protein
VRGLLRLLIQERKRILLGLISLFLVDAAQLVVPLVVRRAVDDLLKGLATSGRLLFLAFLILMLALLIALFRYFWRYFLLGSVRRIEEALRNRLYRHLLTLSPSFYSKRKTGDLMAHATNDIDAIRMALAMGSIGAFDTIVYSTFALTAMIIISPKLTLLTMSPLPLLALTVFFFGRLIHRWFREVQESFSNLTEKVRETLSGIRVVKAFVQERGETEDFSERSEDFVKKNMRLVSIFGLFSPLIMFFANLTLMILLLWGGRLVIFENISLGDFVAFSLYLGMMVWPMIAIGWVTNLVQRGSASLKRIEDLLRTPPDIVEPEKPKEIEIRGAIRVRKLTFSYNGGPPVLREIEFEIKEGGRLGIIGTTASGKSTLVQLIPRIFDPPPGTVFIDGVDVRELPLRSLRSSIGFVPQDGFLFSLTIRENIAFGRPDATDEEIERVAKIAEIYDEIMAFPDGFDTRLGERGITLSGGQRQRVALARALLLEPRILILDDALSAVDSETEARILKNLSQFFKGRTSIVISHRVSAVKDSDLILVMDGGKVIERGTHEELLSKEGLYQKIYEMQKIAEEAPL